MLGEESDMTENNRSANENNQSNKWLWLTPEMVALDAALQLMTSDPGQMTLPVNAADSTARLDADCLPGAMLYVLYGRPGANGAIITPDLVVTALQRMGVSQFDISGPLLGVFGSNQRLCQLTTLANTCRDQANVQLMPLTPADIHEQLLEVVKLVTTYEQVKDLTLGAATLAAAHGLAEFISGQTLNAAPDLSEPAATDTPPNV